ncbi:MAG TPA: N-6 DNA methylase [Microlunatus sp.]
MLSKVVDLLDDIPMEQRDTSGDLCEYLLSKLSTSGANGQFRTPRHIIEAMVAMMASKSGDEICDPALPRQSSRRPSSTPRSRSPRASSASTPASPPTSLLGDLLVAESVGVELIDGRRLASVMIRYGVGVQAKRAVQIVEIDEDFFE